MSSSAGGNVGRPGILRASSGGASAGGASSGGNVGRPAGQNHFGWVAHGNSSLMSWSLTSRLADDQWRGTCACVHCRHAVLESLHGVDVTRTLAELFGGPICLPDRIPETMYSQQSLPWVFRRQRAQRMLVEFLATLQSETGQAARSTANTVSNALLRACL